MDANTKVADGHSVERTSRDNSHQASGGREMHARNTRLPEEMTWSMQRSRYCYADKRLMAEYYAAHDFLVNEGMNPETDRREPAASILVNNGTTGDLVVQEALSWIVKNVHRGPFNIIWYTPGALVPATLKEIRQENAKHNLRSVTQIFLIPGRVDPQIEAVSGKEAAEFVVKLDRHFTYSLLSVNSFDIVTGTAYFHYKDEIELQKACATRSAAHKFLFLDPTKFKREGEAGYNFMDLVGSADAVSIYTVSSEKDLWIEEKFAALCDSVLQDCHDLKAPRNTQELDMKLLRLQIVGKTGESSFSMIKVGKLK